MSTPFEVPAGLETEAGLPLDYLFETAERPFELDSLEEMGFNPFEKTGAKPGSEDKVQVLAARYAAGLPLWHEEDCVDHGPGRVLFDVDV
tara:strand:- start:706 stop:975 length:270 start_codon:yes stop_codon:yes gene_type:complete